MAVNIQILVIDDDQGIRDTYQGIFTPEEEPKEILKKGKLLFGVQSSKEHTINACSKQSKSKKKSEYNISLAENGLKGIELAKKALLEEKPFSVAFIDMKMPGINGAETAKELWAVDPRIRIVIVTAYSEYKPDDIVETTGRDDIFYLRKPFNHEEILQFARALSNEWILEQRKEELKSKLKKANQSLELMNKKLEDINKNLQEKVEKQAALIVQADKMASLGLLAAGVAHEINNPLSFINTNLSALKRYLQKIQALHKKYEDIEILLEYSGLENAALILEELSKFKKDNKIKLIMEDIEDLTDESIDGVDKIKNIIYDLKTFSRVDESQYSYIDINKAIDTTINILWNELKYKADIVKDYGRIPQYKCFPQKLSQVFMNILLNAVQSIQHQGTITITTQLITKEDHKEEKREESFIEIKIKDTGYGIAKENLKKLFDPFFTTKPVGQGTGLGLSITYEIIKAHHGNIDITSELGKGTEVTILLPIMSEK